MSFTCVFVTGTVLLGPRWCLWWIYVILLGVRVCPGFIIGISFTFSSFYRRTYVSSSSIQLWNWLFDFLGAKCMNWKFDLCLVFHWCLLFFVWLFVDHSICYEFWLFKHEHGVSNAKIANFRLEGAWSPTKVSCEQVEPNFQEEWNMFYTSRRTCMFLLYMRIIV